MSSTANRRYFGTDGIRGPYDGPLVNEAFAARLGYGAARWLNETGGFAAGGHNAHGGASPVVLIGRDTRFSGPRLEAAIARGLGAGGADPVSLDIVPTPAVARAVRRQAAALGVVITASHNPASDNGIKFFGPNGTKLTDSEELRIESLLPDVPMGGAAEFRAADALGDYVSAMKGILAGGAVRGWRIVLDTANGATCATSPGVLRSGGAEVIGIGDAPDGYNINAGVGSEHPSVLAGRVCAERATMGIAHDGDGDRCVLCDENGALLDGDEILAILALHALDRNALPNKTVVTTVQSNLGLDAAITSVGGRVLRAAVGDRYVIERMLAEGAALGGEPSGHIICSDISATGDGLVAALKVIQVMSATGKPLSQLKRVLKKYPQATTALGARTKVALEEMTGLQATIVAIESELGGRGRVLVRWSGTEPKLRFLVEGPSDDAVRAGIARLLAAARRDLGLQI